MSASKKKDPELLRKQCRGGITARVKYLHHTEEIRSIAGQPLPELDGWIDEAIKTDYPNWGVDGAAEIVAKQVEAAQGGAR